MLMPNTQSIIDEAVKTIGMEIIKLQVTSSRQNGLDEKQAKSLIGYTQCLISAQKETRDAAKHESGADMTSFDLLKQVKQIAQAEGNSALVKELDETIEKLQDA